MKKSVPFCLFLWQVCAASFTIFSDSFAQTSVVTGCMVEKVSKIRTYRSTNTYLQYWEVNFLKCNLERAIVRFDHISSTRVRLTLDRASKEENPDKTQAHIIFYEKMMSSQIPGAPNYNILDAYPQFKRPRCEIKNVSGPINGIKTLFLAKKALVVSFDGCSEEDSTIDALVYYDSPAYETFEKIRLNESNAILDILIYSWKGL